MLVHSLRIVTTRWTDTLLRKALQALRDFYETVLSTLVQHSAVPEKRSKAVGAGSSISGIWEVCESHEVAFLIEVLGEAEPLRRF